MATAQSTQIDPANQLTRELKENLKAANPGVKLQAVRIGPHLFVVKKPDPVHWTRYEQDNDKSEDYDHTAAIDLVRECVVYPDEAALNAILADKYQIFRPLGDVLGKLVGLERVEELDGF
jgi:hypothetical protein